ncbi:MAG: hypothetical protein VXB67_18690, partial [Deltaproteobacteria bacterium]
SDDTSPPQPLYAPHSVTFAFSADKTADNVTVTWAGDSRADHYELWYTSDNNTTPSSGGIQFDNISHTATTYQSFTIPSGITYGSAEDYYFEIRAKDSTGNYTPSSYASSAVYAPCRYAVVTGLEGSYSSSETSVTPLAIGNEPYAVNDGNYVPGCSTVRLNEHVLQPKYRVTTDMPGWNGGRTFPPGSQLIGLLKDSASAPYDESDYAYAWQLNYVELGHVRSVSVIVNGVVQDTKEILPSSDTNVRFGLELSADGSELYFLMTGSLHSGLVSNHGSIKNGTYNDNQDFSRYASTHRYFDGIPITNPSSYTANAFEPWELRTCHLFGSPESLGSFSDPLQPDAGIIYRATGLSLPTNRSIVITDLMNDLAGPGANMGGYYGYPIRSLHLKFSTREARATDGFSKRTLSYYPGFTSYIEGAEHLIKTEPAPLEHPTGLTITDSTPTSVTMSWTAGAVDNYTLIYDNASGYRVDRERLGYTHPLYDSEKKHHGWWFRSHSSSCGQATPAVWDWDNSSLYFASKPPINASTLPSCASNPSLQPGDSGYYPQQCEQRDFADFRREGISGTSATITGLTEGASDFLLKANHSQQVGFWPYPYANTNPSSGTGWSRTELSYQKTFGAEAFIEKPTGTAVIKTSGSPTT